MILRAMADGRDVNPKRVRYLIEQEFGDELREDYDREEVWSLDYVTQRMAELRKNYELVDRVPPEDSGLYQINELGMIALSRVLEDGETEFSMRDLLEEAGDEEPRTDGARDPDRVDVR